VTTAYSDLGINELRLRLEEAEETLRAIREGEVDALVIGGGSAEEVFTLEGGVEAYRAFMEAMEFGAAALDGHGRLVYANHALGELLGRTAAELNATGLFSALEPAAADAVRAIAAKAADGGRKAAEIRIKARDGDRHLLVSAAPLRLGPSAGVAVTFADLTARVRAAAAEESERMARAVITSANEAVVVCDGDGVVTHVNAAALPLAIASPVGRPFREAFPLEFPPNGLMQQEDLISVAIAGAPVQGIEASAPKASRHQDLLVSAAPLVVAGQQTRGCVVTLVDLTQRKAAERQQLLLMHELDHRVRNTLTLVTAICARTASSSDTIEAFQTAFLGRIQALAATHKLLSDKSWADLTIEEIIQAELAPYVGAASKRVRLAGLDAQVTARAATALGLIFHELTTNAVKYGALSVNEGVIDVRAVEDEATLVVEWRESGGPIVDEPTRSGFGRTVIARSLAFAPDGSAELHFEADGVVCSMRIPAQEVRRSHDN
jgi:PAS domain S-box-containing protein